MKRETNCEIIGSKRTVNRLRLTMKPIHHLVFDWTSETKSAMKLYLSTKTKFPCDDSEHCQAFTAEEVISSSLRTGNEDLTSFLSITRFVSFLETKANTSTDASVSLICYAGNSRQDLSGTAFLLGAYLILRFDSSVEKVCTCFDALDLDRSPQGSHSSSISDSDFSLTLRDRWAGLARAKAAGWVAIPSDARPTLWGMIDAVEYDCLADPLNGDVTIVVPDRLVAFKGPSIVPTGEYADMHKGGQVRGRAFTAGYYAGMLQALGVSTVIRLNDNVWYDNHDFVEQGIEHADLCFEDGTCPPLPLVADYLRIVDSTEGMVAIHCKAGLGRTGTLIALSLIRSHGFSAREAMGWLRIMRPGSVIGRQQDFLCNMEEALKCTDDLISISKLSPSSPAEGSEKVWSSFFVRRAKDNLRAPKTSSKHLGGGSFLQSFKGFSWLFASASGRQKVTAGGANPSRNSCPSLQDIE